MSKAFASLLFSVILALSIFGVAGAQYPIGDGTPRFLATQNSEPAPGPAITLPYGQIINGGAAVYSSPTDPASGIGPISWLGSGFVFVSLDSATPSTYGVQRWYQLHEGGWVTADRVLPYSPSHFQGIEVSVQPQRPFAWVMADTMISNAAGAKPAAGAPHVLRYERVSLLEKQNVDGVNWYRIGPGEWLSQYRVAVVPLSLRPDAIGPTDKWIEVNLFEQTLSAYEGDILVYATLVASGLPRWPTNPGLFRIYEKVRMDKMSGDEGQPDYYYLQDIPWIMYFDNDQALHTAYWHDGFGAPHSHGCVNLAPEDALWLYNWTGPYAGSNQYTFSDDTNQGTWVWVHN